MNYEQKYKNALEKVKELLSCCIDNRDRRTKIYRVEDIESIFPELKESEDEAMRKMCVRYLDSGYQRHSSAENRKNIEKCISWLEKQCNKIVDCPQNHQDVKHPNGGIVMANFNGGEGFYKLHLDYLNKKQVEEVEEMVRMWNKESKIANKNIKNCIGECLTVANEQRFKDYNVTLKDCLNWLEKQGQEPSEHNTADKVEPKFHPGDWIANGGANPCYVKSIFGDYYELCSCEGFEYTKHIIDVNYIYHLWTIADANDGDVVVDKSDGTIGIFQSIGHHPDGGSYNDPSYCFLHCRYDDGFFYADFEHGNTIDSDDLIPATKEQYDLLFQKMNEAGYEWDAEKKELKKIENEIEIPFGAKDSELQEVTYYIPKGFHAEIDDDKVVIKKSV